MAVYDVEHQNRYLEFYLPLH